MFALAACGGSQTTDNSAEENIVTRPMHTDLSQPPPAGEPTPYALPQVEEVTLDNGLQVTFVNRPTFPTVSLQLGIRAGRDSSPDKIAVPEMTARLLREGTENRSAEEISQFMDSAGISYSASTGMNSMTLAVDGIDVQGPLMVDLLADLIENPTFPEDRLQAKQEEYYGELQLSLAQPDFHAGRLASRVLFGEHVYGTTIEPEDVEEITQADIEAFWESTFSPQRARLVVVGSITNELREAVTTTLGAWSNTTPMWSAPDAEPVTTCNVAHVVVRPGSAQTAISWVGPSVSQHDEGYFDTLVANQILGGGIIGRLFLILREERSYTYGAYSGLRELRNAAYFGAMSNVRSDVTTDAVATFLEIFDAFQSGDLPADDVNNNVSYLSGVFPIGLARNSALAGRLLSLYLADLDAPEYLEAYRDALAGVSVEAATAAGRVLIDPANLTLVMVGEEEAVMPAAIAHASTVYVYDLDGELVDTVEGDAESTCE
jgi:predicted Zn-dependent peptidase